MPSKAAAPPVASLNTTKVQQDWANREFMETVQVGVAQLTAFLNRFDSEVRGKLAQLDGKLSKLERRMEVIEGTLQSVDQGA